MTDRDRAIETYGPQADAIIARLRDAGLTVESPRAGLHALDVRVSGLYAGWEHVLSGPSPLTLEMVERAVAQAREMLIDQHNDWTPRRREAGHAALDLFRLCLRQQMGGGQE